MPMIVDLSAPPVTSPVTVVSPDGWFQAAVDPVYAGVVLAVDYTASTPLAGAANVRKVRIRRQDPGSPATLPVRSGNAAWAIGGVGTAYDHEAPLGVAVVYTAVPEYADGTTGPTSSVSVTVPAPEPPVDVWIKSVDEPTLSALVTVTSWPALQWEGRIESAQVEGSRYPTASQSVYNASSSEITIDAEGEEIEVLERLLTTPGVRLIQTLPGYRRPDQFVLFTGVTQAVDTTPDGARTYTASVLEVARPATEGQPLRVPGWSWDVVAGEFASWDAFEASYPSWASASVDGAL
jgi:hypothetical protein